MNVCAVLINYHGAQDISQAVSSILADEPNIEIVVVDNSDDPEEWVRLNSMLPSNVRTVRALENIGFGSGCNLAIETADAPFIFLVNPDVKLKAHCTRNLYRALVANPRLAAVSPRQYLDEACEWLLPPSWLPTAIRSWVTERALREPLVASKLACASYAELLRFWDAKEPLKQRALSGGAMMLRRSALLDEDFVFDPRYFMYFEDTDLCLRLHRRGFHLSIVPEARVIHSWRNEPHKAGLMAESAKIYFDKFFPKDNPWIIKANLTSQLEIQSTYNFSSFPENGLNLDGDWGKGWTFELSPSPLIQPAIAKMGKSFHITEPKHALSHFGASPVYARLKKFHSDWGSDSVKYFRWSK